MNLRAAMIVHPLEVGMFRALVQLLRPDKAWRDELLIKIFEWTHAFRMTGPENICLDGERIIEGSMFMVPFLPEMKDIRPLKVYEKVTEALALAGSDGCRIAAMGAFTSIVIQKREAELEKKYGLRITSGNTLTAAAIIESVRRLAERFQVDLGECTVAIVGASGDIGTACACWFGGRARKLICTARGMLPLQQMVDRYGHYFTCPVELVCDNAAAAQQADIAVFVTSAYAPIVSLDQFKARAIVCDASAPLNVSVGEKPRSDVFLYHGGIVSLPTPIRTGFDVGLASEFHFYGCQVEGLLIALNEALPSSWGRGNITPEKVDIYVQELKKYPGMGLPYTIGSRTYTESEIDEYARAMREPSRPFPHARGGLSGPQSAVIPP